MAVGAVRYVTRQRETLGFGGAARRVCLAQLRRGFPRRSGGGSIVGLAREARSGACRAPHEELGGFEDVALDVRQVMVHERQRLVLRPNPRHVGLVVEVRWWRVVGGFDSSTDQLQHGVLHQLELGQSLMIEHQGARANELLLRNRNANLAIVRE